MTPQELEFNKKDTYTYAEVREMLESAMMDRARYMGFFYKVMPRELFDEYGKKALFAYGQFKAKNPFFDGKPTGDPKVMSDFLVSTNGVSATSFGTDSPVTYDQMLAFMARAAGADTGSGDWSQAAIDWAAENGLTDGLTFSAKNNCPRSDVVYCLWQQMA